MIFGRKEKEIFSPKKNEKKKTMYPRAFGCYLNVGRSLTAHWRKVYNL